MKADFISIAIISLVAAIAPIIAHSIPRKLIPETAVLLVAGAILGPHMVGIVQVSEPISLLSDLGMAFLFLLAGYEIDPKNLGGRQGRAALGTWVASFVIAFALVSVLPGTSPLSVADMALAIALTTTAIGALVPILAERGLLGTREGNLIMSYGTFGELCPVLAIALLLTSRATWVTIMILVAFAGISVLTAVQSKAVRAGEGKIFQFLVDRADSTSQTVVRVTVLLLVTLVAISAVFGLDIVLGAFAAGFVLRYVVPEGNHVLEQKLEVIGYGFLIPLFFIVSGAGIDFTAVVKQPVLLVGFIILLMLVRFVPIVVSLTLCRATRDISWRNRISMAFYCTTALPLIVAVTQVATSTGMMSSDMASVMVAAGAVTVFLMPLLASIACTVSDIEPIETVRRIKASPEDALPILHEQMERHHQIVHDAHTS